MSQVPPFAVLFVCTGNICRSPLAERLLQAHLDSRRFEIASAGVMALVGQEMDKDAAAQLVALGGDPTGFRARQVTDWMIGSADLILTAEQSHRERVLEESPGALKRTFTMLEFAALVDVVGGPPPRTVVADASRHRSASRLATLDVPDPYRRGEAAHAETAQLIHEAIERIAEALQR